MPTVRLVQVIHVRGPEALHEALVAAPLVDELLLDSGNPGATVKELGGTGRVHDWGLSRREQGLFQRDRLARFAKALGH